MEDGRFEGTIRSFSIIEKGMELYQLRSGKRVGLDT